MDRLRKMLNWENMGGKVDGECLNNLRFADENILCTYISKMLQEISGESRQIGLQMNMAKTKVKIDIAHQPAVKYEQLLRATSRDMDTPQTSTEQTCGRTDQHVHGQNAQHLSQGEVKGRGHHQQ